MDTSLKNQVVTVRALARKKMVSVAGILLIPLLYYILWRQPNYDLQNTKWGIVLLGVLVVFLAIHSFLFQVTASDTGLAVRRFIISRRIPYQDITEVRIVSHAMKPVNTIEIRRDGRRVVFFEDACKNADLLVEKLRLHEIPVVERRSV